MLYVPALEGNLLSVKKLAEKGLLVKFEGRTCNIIKDKIIVATAEVSGNLYKLRSEHKALLVRNEHGKDYQHTWHRKLGHRDPEAIKKMEEKNLVTDNKSGEDNKLRYQRYMQNMYKRKND